jgi:hypothetical protein
LTGFGLIVLNANQDLIDSAWAEGRALDLASALELAAAGDV